MTDDVASRLLKLGLTLPPAPSALANYVPFVITGDLLFVSGQVARAPDGSLYTGKVGDTISMQEAQERARQVGLQILSVTKSALGSLDRVARVIKLTGFVNASAGFEDHAQVMNACSDLMVVALGESGRHARSTVGVSGLPGNVPVEIDAIVRIHPTQS